MIYAVGDVHGEADALRELLNKLPVEESDVVIFLGDVIDRKGDNPYDCVEQIIHFNRCHRYFIQGNHEEALLYFLEEGNYSVMNGMDAQSTLDSYERAGYPITPGDPQSIPESHMRLYYQAESWTLPFYITDKYIFTHAGWDLSRPIKFQVPERLRWGKVTGQDKSVWQQTVIRGHSPVPKVSHYKNKQYLGLDTGAGLGGYLSAIALPSMQVYTAKPKTYNPKWYENLRH